MFPGQGGTNQRTRIIDARTGRELADLGAPLRCDTDEETLIVCGDRDFTLFDVEQRSKDVLRDGGAELNPLCGYFFRSDDVIDRAGTVVSTRRWGFVVAMSDRYLVTFPSRSGELAVYRLER